MFTRKVKNQRLAAAGYVWAFASLTRPTTGPAPTTTAAKPVTGTSSPNATCSTGYSAACTTA